MQELNREQIIPHPIEEEMRTSFLDYAMSVIVSRALPDVRDGLKPVHRRIIYAMHREGLASNKPHSKCAGVVGEVLKKYHPHGDSAVYDTLVRMAQDWNLRCPLIDGQGNFGSIDGHPAAAYRYTEARLSSIAETLLTDIDKDTVDYQPNFDGKVEEPIVLPSAFPNLLVNGSAGIAVGMATNIPPHNLGEIIDAACYLIQHPDADIPALMKIIHGPDFPTGGYIHGRQGIYDMYTKGRGKIIMRARMKTEQLKGGREAIVVTEVPYQVNKSRLIADIARLVREKKITGISHLGDESDRDGLRVVMELKKGELAQVVINQLYKHTQLQDTFGAIMLALVDGQPRYLTIDRMLAYYLEHRRIVVRRRTQFDLDKAERRLHIVEGLRIAVDHIDEVIRIIRGSSDTDDARTKLMDVFELSEIQTNAILEMPLRRLTGLERDKLEEEYKELVSLIAELRAILADEEKVDKIVLDELREIRKKHYDERRTEILDSAADLTIEDLIAEERMVITVSHSGYIKRTATDLYRRQRRGGKGSRGMVAKEEDWVEHLFIGTTHDYILFFSNRGKAYWLKVYSIPEGGRAAKGRPMVNLLELEPGEKIMSLIPVAEFDDERFIVMATKKGRVVKNRLSNYNNPRRVGIKAVKVADDDELIGVKLTDGTNEILLGTRCGMAVRFQEEKVRPMGRFTSGVKGINLAAGDVVVGMVAATQESSILTVCEHGFGKRTKLAQYRLTNRGGKGVINIRATERNGPVVGILQVFEQDQIIAITEQGITIRYNVSDLREISRATQGVRLIDIAEGDRVSSLARIEKREEENGENGVEGDDAEGEEEKPEE
jgi:DNA gyrase subunit A